MIDDRERFERASLRFDPPQGGLERLLRRRDRKRRNRRIGSAVIALIIAVAATGSLIAAFRSGRTVPATPSLTSKTVSDLKPAWTVRLDGQTPGLPAAWGSPQAGPMVHLPLPPVVVGGVVYVGTRAGTVYGFPERCGSDCRPLWTADVVSPISFDPAVANGMLFAGTDDGGLFAFRTDCGSDGKACVPEWTAHLGGRLMSSPVVANGVVYGVDVEGYAVAFRVDCGTGGTTCDPLWTAPLTSIPPASAFLARSEHRPTVAGGVVYVVDSSPTKLTALDATTGTRLWYGLVASSDPGHLEDTVHALTPTVDGGSVFLSLTGATYAFPAHCSTDGRSCPPEWIGRGPTIPSGPQVVAGGRVYVVRESGLTRGAEAGVLVAWDERCGTGGAACWPVWVSANDHASSTQPLVVANGSIYAASARGSRIRAYPTSCEGVGTSCGPIWITGGDPYAPTVEGGVIFAGSKQGTVYAFSAGCKATCQPLWTSGPLGAQVSSPTVDGSTIFVNANDGTLRAFSARPRSAPKRLAAAPPYLGLAVLGGALFLGWMVLRRRRRGQPL